MPAPFLWPLLSVAAITLQQQGTAVSPIRIYFERGRSALGEGAIPLALEAAAQLRQQPSAQVVIIGHTDTATPAADANQLSRRMAESVAEAIAAQGVNRSRIRIVAKGRSELAVATPDGIAEPLNRFVAVYVLRDRQTLPAAMLADAGSAPSSAPPVPRRNARTNSEALQRWGSLGRLAGRFFMTDHLPTDMFGPTSITIFLSGYDWEEPGRILRRREWNNGRENTSTRYVMDSAGDIVHQGTAPTGEVLRNRISIDSESTFTLHTPSNTMTKTLLADGRLVQTWTYLQNGQFVSMGSPIYEAPVTFEGYQAAVADLPNRLAALQQRRQQLSAQYMADGASEEAANQAEWDEWEANLPWRRNGSTAMDGLNALVREAEAETRRGRSALDATIAQAQSRGAALPLQAVPPTPPRAVPVAATNPRAHEAAPRGQGLTPNLRFMLSGASGRTVPNRVGGVSNEACESNIVTAPAPVGWPESNAPADALARSYQSRFIQLCAAAGVVVPAGNVEIRTYGPRAPQPDQQRGRRMGITWVDL